MNNENVNRKVFVDLDGVLCDFERGFWDISNLRPDQVKTEELWSIIDAHGKVKFFSELSWMSGGKELWTYITQNFLSVKILTALGKSDAVDKQTTNGKRAWLRHNIPNLSDDDIIMVANKHQKKKYSNQNSIIIDDTPVVIEEWVRKGGIGILHKTVSETIQKLKQYV